MKSEEMGGGQGTRLQWHLNTFQKEFLGYFLVQNYFLIQNTIQ